VGVNHGSFDVFVTDEFLDGADVVTVLEEVGGKGVAEGMRGDRFVDFGKLGGAFYRFLQAGFIDVYFGLISYGTGTFPSQKQANTACQGTAFYPPVSCGKKLGGAWLAGCTGQVRAFAHTFGDSVPMAD
jgi:hypothetical protein